MPVEPRGLANRANKEKAEANSSRKVASQPTQSPAQSSARAGQSAVEDDLFAHYNNAYLINLFSTKLANLLNLLNIYINKLFIIISKYP